MLIGLLIYSFTDVIKSTLKEREESISLNLDTAANKLIFANQQFKDAEEALLNNPSDLEKNALDPGYTLNIKQKEEFSDNDFEDLFKD